MKLQFKDKFSIDINDDGTKLEGTYKLTTKQEKEIKKEIKDAAQKEKNFNKKNTRLQRLQATLKIEQSKANIVKEDEEDASVSFKRIERIEVLTNDIFKLTDELEGLAEELEDGEEELSTILRARLMIEKGVASEQTELLNQCIDAVGVYEVINTILEAVKEGKSKGAKV